MNFILITGPPAVGKMTVGIELAKRLNYKLLHNHDSIELALKFYYFGEKAFNKISDGVRQLVFKTTAKYKEINGLVFTFVWAFDQESDWEYVDNIKKIYRDKGWNTYIVELNADLKTRLERNVMPDRLAAKASKRNIENSNRNLIETDEKYKVTSGGDMIKDENYLFIDNSALSVDKVVGQIMDHFNLQPIDS